MKTRGLPVRLPKKGASRKLAEKLKELGEQSPPQTIVDKVNFWSMIKLDQVYISYGRLFRTVGWLGTNNVAFEEVLISSDMRGFKEFLRVRRVKGRMLYQETLIDFFGNYRIPTKEELRKLAG